MMPVRVALFGCGGWGKNIAKNLQSIGALTVIVDPSAAAKTLANELGVDYLSQPDDVWGDSSISAVAIATPAETHFELAMAAFEAGKHVYVEKPIALSTKDAEMMAAKAASTRLILMVGHLLQYHPMYRALKEIEATGGLGRIRHIISNRLNLGMVRNEENVLWSFSPHDVSMALGLASGTAKRARAIGSDIWQKGIDDIVTLHIHFDDGMVAEIRSSWSNPQKEQKLIVVGEKAMAVFDDTASWNNKLVLTNYHVDYSVARPKAVRGEEQTIAVPEDQPLKLEMQHFVDCIVKESRPLTDAAEAQAVLAVLEAAQQSLDNDGEWFDV